MRSQKQDTQNNSINKEFDQVVTHAFNGIDYFHANTDKANYRSALCCKHALGIYLSWNVSTILRDCLEINEHVQEEVDTLTTIIGFFQYVQKHALGEHMQPHVVSLAMLHSFNVSNYAEANILLEELNDFTFDMMMNYSTHLIFEEKKSSIEQETLLNLNKVHEFFRELHQKVSSHINLVNYDVEM